MCVSFTPNHRKSKSRFSSLASSTRLDSMNFKTEAFLAFFYNQMTISDVRGILVQKLGESDFVNTTCQGRGPIYRNFAVEFCSHTHTHSARSSDERARPQQFQPSPQPAASHHLNALPRMTRLAFRYILVCPTHCGYSCLHSLWAEKKRTGIAAPSNPKTLKNRHGPPSQSARSR